MTGYSEGELHELSWDSIMHTEPPLSLCDFAGSAVEKRYQSKNGEALWVRMAIASILHENFRQPGNLILLEKVTDRKLAEERERRRIARELHDTTGQSVTALIATLSLVRQGLGLPQGCMDGLAECLFLAKQASDEIRTLSFLFYPPALDQIGFVEALRQYSQGFGLRSGIEVELQVSQRFPVLESEAASALFHVMMESLNNVWRHSGSDKATIRFAADSEEIQLQVEDFGLRWKPQSDPANAASIAGLGIPGMRERMRQLGGDLDVSFGAGGTVVTAHLPIYGGIHP
jgi:signal transduction histidine kinase